MRTVCGSAVCAASDGSPSCVLSVVVLCVLHLMDRLHAYCLW